MSPVENRDYLDQLMWVEGENLFLGFCGEQEYKRELCQFGKESVSFKKFETIFLNKVRRSDYTEIDHLKREVSRLKKMDVGQNDELLKMRIADLQYRIRDLSKEVSLDLNAKVAEANKVIEALKSRAPFAMGIYSPNDKVGVLSNYRIGFSTIEDSFSEALAGQRPLVGDSTRLDVYLWRTRRHFNFSAPVTWGWDDRHLVLKEGQILKPRNARLAIGDKACVISVTKLPVVKGSTTVGPSEKMSASGSAFFNTKSTNLFYWTIERTNESTKQVDIRCGRFAKTYFDTLVEFQPGSDLTLTDFKDIVGSSIELGGEIVY
jgi:hypothetical protein